MNGPVSKLARCVIYTRKSTEYILHSREALHLAFELGELLLEVCRLGRKRLRRLLQIGRVELAQIYEMGADGRLAFRELKENG
jgi:hypothetical protein